jgi:putative NIF3 family GTP cyclohydrolase 1 type 2
MRILIRVIAGGLLATAGFAADTLTARQVVEKIQKQVGVPWDPKTIDTFKAGNPDTPVTGIATTFAATLDVLERAVASGKNFIISHEPTFYSHTDETASLKGDPIYQAKRDYIDKHKLVVWRFHDHWHARHPDGVMVGVAKTLGWTDYQDPKTFYVYNLPPTTLGKLASDIKARMSIRTMRVIGDPSLPVTKVALAPGAAGAPVQMRALSTDGVQVLIAGESREWETVEYARDAVTEKKGKALILLGHVPSEEPGMEECAQWLKTFLPGIPVEFIPAHEPFWAPE